jgi:hypothetical protein
MRGSCTVKTAYAGSDCPGCASIAARPWLVHLCIRSYCPQAVATSQSVQSAQSREMLTDQRITFAVMGRPRCSGIPIACPRAIRSAVHR